MMCIVNRNQIEHFLFYMKGRRLRESKIVKHRNLHLIKSVLKSPIHTYVSEYIFLSLGPKSARS